MENIEDLEECRIVPVEFFEYLLQRLGNPQSVEFYLHGSELKQMAKRLLGEYKISPTDTYDLVSGKICYHGLIYSI